MNSKVARVESRFQPRGIDISLICNGCSEEILLWKITLPKFPSEIFESFVRAAETLSKEMFGNQTVYTHTAHHIHFGRFRVNRSWYTGTFSLEEAKATLLNQVCFSTVNDNQLEVWNYLATLDSSEYKKLRNSFRRVCRGLTARQTISYLDFVVKEGVTPKPPVIDIISEGIRAIKKSVKESEQERITFDFIKDFFKICEQEPSLYHVLIEYYDSFANNKSAEEIEYEIEMISGILSYRDSDHEISSLVYTLLKYFPGRSVVEMILSIASHEENTEKLYGLIKLEEDMSKFTGMPVEWVIEMF